MIVDEAFDKWFEPPKELKDTRENLDRKAKIILGYISQMEEVTEELDLPMKSLIMIKLQEIKSLTIPSYRFYDIKYQTILILRQIKLDELLVGKAKKVYRNLGCSTLFDLLDFHYKRVVHSAFDFCPSGVSQENVKILNKQFQNLGITFKIEWTS